MKTKRQSYRRLYVNGGCYFFTVVTDSRRPILTGPNEIIVLRQAFKHVMTTHPFNIDAIVILPDHIHTVWTLPYNTADFSIRWRLIKAYFTKNCDPMLKDFYTCDSKMSKLEQPIWQRRFWEHKVRNARAYKNIIQYIHMNPVRHGYVDHPGDWPFSSYSTF